MRVRWLVSSRLLAVIACCLTGCDRAAPQIAVTPEPVAAPSRPVATVAASPIVVAARSQVGVTVTYDPAYVRLAYPGGDVPIAKGVCTDVVVRALRTALAVDLQKCVHEDMRAAFSSYPAIWGLKKPDRNIDHRRVPNLQTYFKRRGYAVAVTREKTHYLPGDIVTCTVGRNRPHIMIVSDRTTGDGTPLVIHNMGRGAREENHLFSFPLTGHYRLPRGAAATE